MAGEFDLDSNMGFHPAITGAETIDYQSGESLPLLESAKRGLGSAAISGYLSIYNTFRGYAGKEMLDTQTKIDEYDQGWGDYYSQHKEGVDFVGFLGAALLPASAGIKALKLAQTGEAAGAIGRALSISSTNKNRYLAEAMDQLAASGGSVTSQVMKAKWKQFGWSTADQALQATAAELAIAATMNQSPMFHGDDIWDFATNIAIGTLAGGAIGGLLEHAGARGILKRAQDSIQTGRREFDTIYNPERLNMIKGNETLVFAQNLVDVSDDFYNVNFRYRPLDSKESVTRVLETNKAFKSIYERSQQSAFDTLSLKMNELAGGNEGIGQEYFRFIAKKITEGRAAGRSRQDITDEIGGYLMNVTKLRPVSEVEQGAGDLGRVFFVNKEPKDLTDLFTEVAGKSTTKQGYRILGDKADQVKVKNTADVTLETQNAAWREGADMIIGADGRAVINPASKTIRKGTNEALMNHYFVDLEHGTVTPDAVLTAADTMRRPGDWNIQKDAIYVGGKRFAQQASVVSSINTNAVESSARFMWAREQGKQVGFFKDRVLDVRDIPVMEALLEKKLAAEQMKDIQVRLANGNTTTADQILNLREEVQRVKAELLAEQLGANPVPKGRDTRHIAAALNLTSKEIEELVTHSFAPSKVFSEAANPLDRYFRPTTVAAEYDMTVPQLLELAGPLGPGHKATQVLGHQYDLLIHKNVTENAANSVLGEDADKFINLPEDLAKKTSETGAGSSMFGAANADYGKQAELYVQEIGKQLSLVSQKVRDAAIGALSPQIAAVRATKENAAELGILTTALRRDVQKYRVERVLNDLGELESYRLVDRDAYKLMQVGDAQSLDDAIEYLQQQGRRGAYDIKSKAVGEFFEQSTALNKVRIGKNTTLYNAAGLARKIDADSVYVPPIDTRRYPYFAFVRAKDKLGTNTDISMITAQSEEQLRQLAAKVPGEFDVIYKSDTERFFKARGEYDYSAGINESRVNSELQKSGVLSDFFPETRAENVLEDYVRWHASSEEQVVRRAVETKYRQFFSELNFLSEQFTLASKSVARGKVALLEKRIADPFDDYRKVALNLSKQSEYPLMDSLNEFVDRIGTKLYSTLDGLRDQKSGLVDYEAANKLMKDAGLGSPYRGVEEYMVANQRYPTNLVRTFFQKANYALATVALRFDFANAIVNTISTPILLGTEVASIRNLIKTDPGLTGKLADLMSVKVPGGQGQAVPSTTKLIAQAMNNYFGSGKAELIARYEANGDIKQISRLYHDALDDLAYREHLGPSKVLDKMDQGAEKLSKLTGNNFSEEFTRFVAADVMRQISDPLIEAGKMSLREQNAYISSFVNRVQGNYVTSQRPIVFQGTTGSAISLFQTYAFNVLQQLLRHVGNRDQKALWTFAGLQSSIYGFNGLPFFEAVNTQLLGKLGSNPEHQDIYLQAQSFNKELGDWMMYGTASAFPLFGDKAPALYSRGDMNPRHLSILPVSPMDVPAVSASIKLVQALTGMGKNLVQGADVSTAMLQALEHHGWNRPLAGFAQVLQGEATTNQGSLISAANDLETTSLLTRVPSRIINYGGASRLIGAKPMDEAIALERLYRDKSYQAADRAKIEAIGKAIKTKLSNNQMPTEEEMNRFMENYAIGGGRIETFSSALQHWMRDSNESIVNQMGQKIGSRYGRHMQTLMGGENPNTYLGDYTNGE